MDLAYVDKLAKENSGVKYLPVRQDFFDKTVDANGIKTKDSKESVRALLTMITKRKRPEKIWVDKETDFAGEFKKLCRAGGIQLYSTMTETKAPIAERTIRSRENLLYSFLEDNGYKYFHKLTEFVTTLISRRKCSIDVIPKNGKSSDFLSILNSKPLRDFRKPKYKIWDRVRISKYDLPFVKGYKPQFKQEVFKIVTFSSRKTPTYAINNEQGEFIRGNFYQKD